MLLFDMPLLLLILFSFLLITSQLSAREVENSERLRLLRQATGSDSSSQSSFEARVDSTFGLSTDAESTKVAADETSARQQAQIEATDELQLISKQQERTTEMVKPDKEQPKKEKPDKTIVDASEESYLKEVDEINRKASEKLLESQMTAPSEVVPPLEPAAPTSNQPPSLANNPFYFAPQGSKQFEENKPVIVSRLVQSGYSRREAEQLVSEATTSEEIIISLMQQENYSYGDAEEIVK